MSLSKALGMGDLSEQARNYTKSILHAADGNYTKLFSILLNDTVKKGFLTEKDKNTISPYLMGLTSKWFYDSRFDFQKSYFDFACRIGA